jgi:hypothetical protein
MTLIDRIRHLGDTPLANARRSIWWIRKTFFTKPRSSTPALVVPLSKPEATHLLGRHHFEPGWETSYRYRGEILNLRRAEHVDHSSGLNWWQVHIRGYNHPNGLELAAHFETEPTEHPDAHIELFKLDVERGMATLTQLLDEHELEYNKLSK